MEQEKKGRKKENVNKLRTTVGKGETKRGKEKEIRQQTKHDEPTD